MKIPQIKLPKKKIRLTEGARQALFGVVLAVLAVAAALVFSPASAGGGEVSPLPEAYDAESLALMLDARDEQKRVEEERVRREEENSRRLQEAEEGMRENGWQTSAEKDAGNGDPAVWREFRDYAILGDSRAVGFSYYNLLEYDRVLASGGDTIRRLPERYEDLKRLQPSCLFFCYGLNDAGIGYWMDGETYAEEFMERIEEIREFLPNAKFVISSTLPVTDEALSWSPGWKRIELFNAALAVVCPAHRVVFVDNDGLARQYLDTLWGPDGIHLREEFYPYWGNALMDGLRRARAGEYYPEEETATEAGAP